MLGPPLQFHVVLEVDSFPDKLVRDGNNLALLAARTHNHPSQIHVIYLSHA